MIPAQHHVKNCYVDCLLRYISPEKEGHGEGSEPHTDRVTLKEMKRYENHPIVKKTVEVQLCKDVKEDSIDVLKSDLNVVTYLLRRALPLPLFMVKRLTVI